MACWACLNLAGHLKRLPLNLLPSNAPERRRAERAVESLRRLALHPALAQSTDAAEAVWRSDSHAGLVDRVRSRLRSGHVTNPSPYEALADWVDGSDTARLIGEMGDVDWMFYDESFDTKLFEIWSLHRLIQGLTVRLGEPQARRHLVDRSQGAVATWTVGGVTVEVWFQAGLGTIDVGGPRWQYSPQPADETEPTGPFGGIPDIIAVIDRQGRRRQPVILDPKLRRRPSVPGAEIYKIIGYFGNLPADHAQRGGIIFHGPDHLRSYRITNGADGEIIAVAVDPLAAEESEARFQSIADFVLASIPPSTMTRARGPNDSTDPDAVEDWVDRCQREAVEEMLESITEGALGRARKAMRSNLLDTWAQLDEGTQRMLATAEHFGASSGPKWTTPARS